jgi:uncharacterized protein
VTASRVAVGRPVVLDVRLSSLNEGIVVTGTVRADWEGECRRCLTAVRGTLEVPVQEVFETRPVEGETSLLDVDRIDLEPLARESVLLELPQAPLCRDDCGGLCPVCGERRDEVDCGHDEPATDPRWSALRDLDLGS